MSNLSDLLPTGGGQNAVDFVASGTLGSGQTVVLNSNGTVSVVAVGGPSVGDPTVFESALIRDLASTYDQNAGKIVVFYRDNGNSNSGTAAVGTVAGTSISFGTPVVFKSGDTREISACYDSLNNKVVVFFRNDSVNFYGNAIVGTVSGTTISFGAQTVFFSAVASANVAVFDTNTNKTIVAFSDGTTGKTVVGTVSGTSISFGAAVVFENATTSNIGATFDSNSNKVVIAYRDDENSSYGTSIVGTVSGTTISFGTAVVFESARADGMSLGFDSNSNKVVIAYQDPNNTDSGTVVVGTVSGTTISFGTPVVFASAINPSMSLVYDPYTQKAAVAYYDNNGNGLIKVGVVSGTSITFDPAVYSYSTDASNNGEAFVSTNSAAGLVISYIKSTNSYGTSNVVALSSTNNTSFIGITAEAIADTATGSVNVFGGINEAQSGLTIGSDYYVQADGSIATTVSDVKIGQAISATTINIRDLT
jgi:hypothetical protein